MSLEGKFIRYDMDATLALEVMKIATELVHRIAALEAAQKSAALKVVVSTHGHGGGGSGGWPSATSACDCVAFSKAPAPEKPEQLKPGWYWVKWHRSSAKVIEWVSAGGIWTKNFLPLQVYVNHSDGPAFIGPRIEEPKE